MNTKTFLKNLILLTMVIMIVQAESCEAPAKSEESLNAKPWKEFEAKLESLNK